MDVKELLGKQLLILDGALGTALQAAGLEGGQLSEKFNFDRPEIVKKIYKDYIYAGSNIISTNTFSSNARKLTGQGFDVSESIKKAVEVARQAIAESGKDVFIAQDIGPTGEMMKPVGDLDFDTAYELIKEQVTAGRQAGADIHFFETFSDITELRTGVLAAKENSDLPVFCSVTFGEDGRMLLGTDPETAAYILQDMGVDAIGINCSLGPKEIIPLIKRMLKVSKIPVIVQPNAGMPRMDGDETFYDVSPEEFTESMWEMIEAGAAILGGCCGTTPLHIRELTDRIENENTAKLPGLSRVWYEGKLESAQPTACTANRSIVFGEETIIIGEKINPTGRKDLKAALKGRDYGYIENEALRQQNSGAHIVNLNVGMEDIDWKHTMEELTESVAEVISVPLQIDSSDPEVIESGVRKYGGKPIVNSVNGEQKSMDLVFPIVKKYGTAVIALTLDENGIPKSTEDRLIILDKIISEAAKYGITKDRIIVDTLALTVSTDPKAAKNTLKAIEVVTDKYKMNTILGASNISFGLPNRDLINRAFLSMAVYAGISSIITDPTKPDYMDEIKSAEVLSGRDAFAEKYICYNKKSEGGSSEPETENKPESSSLQQIIMSGREGKAAEATEELLKEKAPMDIINEIVIPSLEIIGNDYEAGKTFLPQMIKSAEAVKRTFDVLKPIIAGEGKSISRGRIAMATVKGDIHDIGKNIVRTVLENYGYDVIDIGKDVSTETIISTLKSEKIKLLGLSALMTTTMVNMKPTIDALTAEDIDCKVAVGGAVLTEEYADRIGADFYCETAMDTVRAAENVFSQKVKGVL